VQRQRLWDKLEKLGVRPERLQLEWISAADGKKFAEVMKALDEPRRRVTREEIEHGRRVLSEDRAKREAKAQARRRAAQKKAAAKAGQDAKVEATT
jgi:heterodisulfide reductase subunit A